MASLIETNIGRHAVQRPDELAQISGLVIDGGPGLPLQCASWYAYVPLTTIASPLLHPHLFKYELTNNLLQDLSWCKSLYMSPQSTDGSHFSTPGYVGIPSTDKSM